MAEHQPQPAWRRDPKAMVAFVVKSLVEIERGVNRMSLYLKIKEQSLAAEARLIRAQELRLKRRIAKARSRSRETTAAANADDIPGYRDGLMYERDELVKKLAVAIDAMDISRVGLHSHRTKDVRTEARATHLARGFLKGMPYKQMEQSAWTAPPMPRVKSLVEKYAPGDIAAQVTLQRFAEWTDAAKAAHKLPVARIRRPRTKPRRTLEEWELIQKERGLSN